MADQQHGSKLCVVDASQQGSYVPTLAAADCVSAGVKTYLLPTLRQKLFSCSAGANAAGQVCTAVCYEASLSRIGLLHQIEQSMGELVSGCCISVLLYDRQKDRQHLCMEGNFALSGKNAYKSVQYDKMTSNAWTAC